MILPMRTTICLEDDALALARTLARQRRVSLGKAVSELVRRGARAALRTTRRDGLHVVELPDESPEVASQTVQRLVGHLP